MICQTKEITGFHRPTKDGPRHWAARNTVNRVKCHDITQALFTITPLGPGTVCGSSRRLPTFNHLKQRMHILTGNKLVKFHIGNRAYAAALAHTTLRGLVKGRDSVEI